MACSKLMTSSRYDTQQTVNIVVCNESSQLRKQISSISGKYMHSIAIPGLPLIY